MGIKSFFVIGIIMYFTTQICQAGPPPLPPTPPKEVFDKLRELGRQNELKYGSGISQAVPTKIIIYPSQTPTVLPPLPSPIVTNSPILIAPSVVPSHKLSDLSSSFFIINLMKNLLSIFTAKSITPPPLVVKTEITKIPSPIPTTDPRPRLLWNKGFDIWVNTKDYASCSKYYKQALDINPDFVPALASYGFMLGVFYKQPNTGEAMLKKAMKLDPTWAYAPYNLGLLYDIIGRNKEGIYWLQYTVDHFPHHPDIEWFKEHLQFALEKKI